MTYPRVGRPAVPADRRRTEVIRLMLSSAERAALLRLSAGEPMSATLRRLLAEATAAGRVA